MGDQRTRLARRQEERETVRTKWRFRGVVTLGVLANANTAFEFVGNLIGLAGF